MTGRANEYAAAVEIAARWLATTRRDQVSGPVVPLLRHRFSLTAIQAVEAIRESRLILARSV